MSSSLSSQGLKPCQLPPLLKPGDLVTAIAPAGAVKSSDAIERGLAVWRSRGYRVEMGANYRSCCGYLAGNDRQRRADLVAAWQNPESRAIIAVRGGYGSSRLLEDWTWCGTSPSSISPQWLIGFSDITSLLWSLANVGISGLHSSVLTTLAAEPEWAISRMFNYLETGQLEGLQGRGGISGQAEGILLPGNLTVATHLLNTPSQPSLTGVILALEDVTEYPYRLDRLLTQWRMMGAFKEINGIALGRFSRCEPYPGTSSWSAVEVLRDRLEDLGVPLVYDLPFGHDGANAALPVGQPVHLDGDRGILSWANSAKILETNSNKT
ncbi:MAG: LD-carboxypeptidase [Cyanobacteria bacterium J06623_7]